LARVLFGTNGIRGVANQDLTPEFATKVGLAVGTFFKGGEVYLGRDGRTSGQMISKAAMSGLGSAGCSVYDLGQAPSPAIQYAVRHFRPSGGVIITASHNPPEYNGIKVLGNDGVEISRQEEEEIEDIFFQEKDVKASWDRIKPFSEKSGVLDLYRQAITKHVDAEAIHRRRLKVVVDPGNGVGALVTPYLARELGCDVVTINSQVDGNFPGRLPEPTPDHLGELAATVKALGADLGVAHDGDADRAIFVDERGGIQWGDRTFALVERSFLQKNPGEQVVTPVSSSKVVLDIAEKYGGRLVWTRVGSVIVSQTMKNLGAKLGGEENGGIFYGPHQPVRDGAMSTALILEIMSNAGRSLSDLLSELPTYMQDKKRVACPNELKEKTLQRLRESVREGRIETTDGLKVWYQDGSWVLIRPSGTEPIYRVFSEARDLKRAEELTARYTSMISKIVQEIA
jgi:phosphomannomutase/phosphoglucomutase